MESVIAELAIVGNAEFRKEGKRNLKQSAPTAKVQHWGFVHQVNQE